MAKHYNLPLHFPLAGVDRSAAYRQHQPYASPDALNVRPVETIEGRARGGSRPGIGKAYVTELGGGTPVNMMAEVTTAGYSGLRLWEDSFFGGLSGSWEAASWLGPLPPIYTGVASASVDTGRVGAVLEDLSINPAALYGLSLDIVPYEDSHWGQYAIFVGMDDATPDASADGMTALLELQGTEYSGKLYITVDGVPTEYDFVEGDFGYAASGTFQVTVNSGNIHCYFNGIELIGQAHGALAGTRVGFAIECLEEGGVCLVDKFQLQYFVDSDIISARPETHLIVASGGNLYDDQGAGLLSQVAGVQVTQHPLGAASHNQRLFIADYGGLRVIGEGTIDATGLQLSGAGVTDWRTVGVDTDRDIVWLSNMVGSAENGIYQIDSVTEHYLLLDVATGGDGTGTVQIMRAPKYYDPATETAEIWGANAGFTPPGCPVVCRYRDRLVLAGAYYAPHVWYMSRQNNPFDWDYTQEDAQAAVAGTSSDAGTIGDKITALIPWKDDYLIFGCENQIWILRGDPAAGGMIDNVSYTIGMLGMKAWCRGISGELFWMDKNGLYLLPPNAESIPTSISEHVLPEELKMAAHSHLINMEYDTEFKGVHIYATPIAGGSAQHWWFSWTSKGFWPVSLPIDIDPHSVLRNSSGHVLLGCADGYIRRYRKNFYTDDGTLISSHVVYGPIALGRGDFHEGLLSELVADLASGSGAILWSLHVGQTHQEAVVASAFATGAWHNATGLRTFTSRPRARGNSFCVKLSNAGYAPWAIEHISAKVKNVGKLRKG